MELDLWKAMKEELKKTTGLDFQDDGSRSKTLDNAVSNRHSPNAKNKCHYGIIYPLCGYRTLELRVLTGPERLSYGVSGRDHSRKSMRGEREYESVRTLLENHPDLDGDPHPAWPYLKRASTFHDAAIASREDADRLVEEIAKGMKAIYGAIASSPGE